MGMFLARVVEFIEKVEARILQWMRLLTVVVVASTLFAGAVTFLISAAMASTSTDVSVGTIENPEFVEPDIRNVAEAPAESREEDPEPRERPLKPRYAKIYRDYEDSVDDVVEALHPLDQVDGGEMSESAYRDYVIVSIEKLQESIATVVAKAMPHEGSDGAESRTEDAVDGLVDYAEDMADYYGDEVDIDTSGEVAKSGKPLVPEFRRHLSSVMQNPIAQYSAKYLQAFEAEVMPAVKEAEESEETVKAGMAGFAFLLPVGGVVVLLLFLLLLFKIEIRLRDDAPAAAEEEQISGPTPEEQGRP